MGSDEVEIQAELPGMNAQVFSEAYRNYLNPKVTMENVNTAPVLKQRMDNVLKGNGVCGLSGSEKDTGTVKFEYFVIPEEVFEKDFGEVLRRPPQTPPRLDIPGAVQSRINNPFKTLIA